MPVPSRRTRSESPSLRAGSVVHRRSRLHVRGKVLVRDALEPGDELEAHGDARLRQVCGTQVEHRPHDPVLGYGSDVCGEPGAGGRRVAAS